MLLIISYLFFFLSSYTYAFECRFNDSAIITRDNILLKLEDHQYVRMHNISIDIETGQVEFIGNDEQSRSISSINFKGQISKDTKSRYVETSVYSLRGYSYTKKENKCKVSFQESDSDRGDINIDEETAILRLAESCIRSELCKVDVTQIDRDGDLYFQSTQSVLNELIDFYTPRVVNLFLSNDKQFMIEPINVTVDDFYFIGQGGSAKGIDTIQRTKDILIKYGKSKYTLELGFRFEKLDILLTKTVIGWKSVRTFGDFSGNLRGISLGAKLAVEIKDNTCILSLVNAELISIKEIIVNIPVLNMFSIPYTVESENLSAIQVLMLSYINSAIPKINFDCQEYINQLDQAF